MKYFYSLFILIVLYVHQTVSMDKSKHLQLFTFSTQTLSNIKKNIKSVKDIGNSLKLENNNLHTIYKQLYNEVKKTKGISHLLQSSEPGSILAYNLMLHHLIQNPEYTTDLTFMLIDQKYEQSFIDSAKRIGAELLTINSVLHLPYTIPNDGRFKKKYECYDIEKIFQCNAKIDLKEGRTAVIANIILIHFIDQVAFLSDKVRKKNIETDKDIENIYRQLIYLDDPIL